VGRDAISPHQANPDSEPLSGTFAMKKVFVASPSLKMRIFTKDGFFNYHCGLEAP
jgi:hypothetical protein